jgi:hypothetical protein
MLTVALSEVIDAELGSALAVLVVCAEDERVRLSLTLGTNGATHVWLLLGCSLLAGPNTARQLQQQRAEGGRQEKRVGKQRRRHARTGFHRLNTTQKREQGTRRQYILHFLPLCLPCAPLFAFCRETASVTRLSACSACCLSVRPVSPSPREGNESQHDGTDETKNEHWAQGQGGRAGAQGARTPDRI